MNGKKFAGDVRYSNVSLEYAPKAILIVGGLTIF